MLTQRGWRTIGAVTLAACALMAIFGARVNPLASAPFFFGYWLVFLVLFLVTLWMAVIDFRYIRLRMRAEERRIFMETLGDAEFRKTLRKGQEEPHSPPKEGE